MKKATKQRRTKVSPKTAQQRLWAIDVCPTEAEQFMTVLIMAPTVRLALEAAERRYPNRFQESARGHALEIDHAVHLADGTLETIKARAWWREGFLPDFSQDEPDER